MPNSVQTTLSVEDDEQPMNVRQMASDINSRERMRQALPSSPIDRPVWRPADVTAVIMSPHRERSSLLSGAVRVPVTPTHHHKPSMFGSPAVRLNSQTRAVEHYTIRTPFRDENAFYELASEEEEMHASSQERDSIDSSTRQPNDHRPDDHRSDDHRSDDHRSVDHRPVDHRPVDHRPVDHRPVDHRPVDHRPVDHRPVDHRPVDHRPVDHRPVDHRPVDHRPVDHRPVDHRPVDHRPVDHRPVDHRSAGPLSVEHKPAEHAPPEHPTLVRKYQPQHRSAIRTRYAELPSQSNSSTSSRLSISSARSIDEKRRPRMRPFIPTAKRAADGLAEDDEIVHLYTRYLQWQMITARADRALSKLGLALSDSEMEKDRSRPTRPIDKRVYKSRVTWLQSLEAAAHQQQ